MPCFMLVNRGGTPLIHPLLGIMLTTSFIPSFSRPKSHLIMYYYKCYQFRSSLTSLQLCNALQLYFWQPRRGTCSFVLLRTQGCHHLTPSSIILLLLLLIWGHPQPPKTGKKLARTFCYVTTNFVFH